MKFTGLILALVGLIAGVVCMVVVLDPIAPNREDPANEIGIRLPNMVVPLAVCGACVVIGAMMHLFGGRSYVVSNDPRVRN